MEILGSLIIVGFAALIHASFQLSVSVLSLLTSHSIGSKKSHSKTLRLMTGFTIGTAVMTLLLLSFLCFMAAGLFPNIPAVVWAIGSGLLFGLGIAVWLFYYRRGAGTTLWIPREFASFLSERSKATKRSAEAFGLGLTSVIAEIIFIFAPILISALTISHLPFEWQLASLLIYTFISILPLLIIFGYVGSGHKLSRVQKWRENNKRFLQFTGGLGLVALGFFVYVTQVTQTAALDLTGSILWVWL